MALATFTCRIAFASNPFDAAPVWNDVTSSLMSFSIRRGRQYELNRMEAGTAEVSLLNISGDFWPNNTGGAYSPNVKPWKRINLRGTYDGTTYDLFTGYVENWSPDFLLPPIKGPVKRIRCADAIKNLSKMLLNDAVGYAEEKSGARVGHVLDTLGWPAGARTIDTGQTTIQASGALTNINAMSHLFTIQDSEWGRLFVSGDGKMTFQDRHGRFLAPYIVSQGIFGDNLGAGELPYTGITPEMDEELVWNDVRVTRLSGTEQVASDATSQGKYGKRSLQRPNLLMLTDAEALAQAQYLLSLYKDPSMRVKQITIKPGNDPANLWPKALGFDISTRVTVRLAQASINEDFHIEGIEHRWDRLNSQALETKWWLTNAAAQSYWIVGETGFSEIGETTRLAY